MRNRKQIEEIALILEEIYGNPRLNNQADPIDEIIFILLSEKTNESNYLPAFKKLKSQFPNWESLLTSRLSMIRNAIRGAGMGYRRAILIKRALIKIKKLSGELDLSFLRQMPPEKAEEVLCQIPGIGPKAARCVLLYCFDIPLLPVDIHTYRLAIRLGILPFHTSYERSHKILPSLIPSHLRLSFHVNAVAHGRARCFGKNPTCNNCPLKEYCSYPSAEKPINISVRPRPLAIDLFAGAGGLSLGFEQTGFQVVQAIECDPNASRTYKKNHPETDLITLPIENIDPFKCMTRLGIRPGDLTILIGGPPCQGFSESNRRTRTVDNPKNHLYKEFVRFLDAFKPIWFVIENVAGLQTLERGTILHKIIGDCKNLGYEVAHLEFNAADYGVPQLRHRLFIIGNRLNIPFSVPTATHGLGRKPKVTVRQAISDLPDLENGSSEDSVCYRSKTRMSEYQQLMRGLNNKFSQVQGGLVTHNSQKIIRRYEYIRPGQNWEAIPSKLMKNYKDRSRCHTGIYYRLEWDKPAKVIGNFRKNMLIHPKQNRGLSIREAARLQSFPDGYIFIGSIGFQQQQVADAVPPILAEAVARKILKLTMQTFK